MAPAKILGTVDTVSVPKKTKFPPIVMLVAVRLKPFKLTLAAITLLPELIVKVEMFTAAVNVGMFVTVETIKAESCGDNGTPVSQFDANDQFVFVVPHQVRSFPDPPKFQFLLFPLSDPLLVSVINVPGRASESFASTQDTLLVPVLFNIQFVGVALDRNEITFPLAPVIVSVVTVKVEFALK